MRERARELCLLQGAMPMPKLCRHCSRAAAAAAGVAAAVAVTGFFFARSISRKETRKRARVCVCLRLCEIVEAGPG